MDIIILRLILLISLSSRLVSATSENSTTPTYDFVIIGGGTSGLSVADRLTENPDVSVLVLEYGPFDRKEPFITVPGLLNFSTSPYVFNLTSTPQRELLNASFRVPAGGVVGGGTTVNGMFFDRGAAVDYDAWEELGNPGWGWEGLLPYFQKSENFTRADQAFSDEFEILADNSVHGFHGPVQSSYPVFQWEAIKNFFSGWHTLGISTPSDPNGGVKRGVFWSPSSLDPRNETRSYARTAHYDRVSYRDNYHILTEVSVSRILFNENGASGVEYIDRSTGETCVVQASREVILAAGAPHSPQILQLSGIGPASLLQDLGIDVLVDLPGVGQNLQDHPTLFSVFELRNQAHPNIDDLSANTTYAAEQLSLYYAERRGPYTIVNQGGNTVAFLSLPDLTDSYRTLIAKASNISTTTVYPDLDQTVLAGYESQKNLILHLYSSTNTSVQESGFNGAAVVPITVVKPLSRGSVKINSTSILSPPIFDWGALTYETDLDIMVLALQANSRLMASEPMQLLSPVELVPGSNATSEEELKAGLRGMIQPTYSHPCCTCAMLPRALGGVVGSDLLVHGTRRLSVVDASVMPLIPAAHTSATVYAVAEKAADIIKARHRHK
ncbi:alcohol oxidase [Xylariomycetidae sp. FL2044]|nr:alcohol oxidase [Xylariomycetidae sp. FL2044]